MLASFCVSFPQKNVVKHFWCSVINNNNLVAGFTIIVSTIIVSITKYQRFFDLQCVMEIVPIFKLKLQRLHYY